MAREIADGLDWTVMLRYGFVSRDELPPGLSVEAEPPPAIAFTMLADFEEPLTERDETAIEIICNAIAAGHGLKHRRRTFAHRYDVINDAIVEVLRSLFPGDPQFRVYDVGVSNGVTSVELFRALSQCGDVTLHAMDYLDRLWVIDAFGPWRVVFDDDGRPLQFVGGRLVLTAQGREPRSYPLNRLLAGVLKLVVLPIARRRFAARAAGAAPGIRTVSAFHPEVIAFARNEPRFQIGHGDMFVPTESPYEVVRAMSVLSHLDSTQVEKAVKAMCATLRDGGLFVAGRNPGRHSTAIPTTIFRRRGSRLEAVSDLMGGVDERQTILDVELDSGPTGKQKRPGLPSAKRRGSMKRMARQGHERGNRLRP